jgi:hypothetical protein
MKTTTKRQPTRFQQMLFSELREHIRNGVPYHLTFLPTNGMSKPAVKKLEDELRINFDRYMDTWISPWIDRLEKSMGGQKGPTT